MKNRLTIAIQKNGRLSEQSIDLLKKSGINFSYKGDKLLAKSNNLPIDILFVRSDDIPSLVSNGDADLAIVGENILIEKTLFKRTYIEKMLNLGFSKCRLSFAVPQNSNIKNFKNKIFVVDYKNTLRCYNVKDGSECWNLQTEDSFTISNSKYSLLIIDEMVVFSNSVGDITSVDIETGLIIWQLPTQSSNIINETYNFKISKLVSDGNSIFFSNNKNEIYSVDAKTGIVNWINNLNSNIKPVIVGNLIFTVSDEGYLYVIEKNKGNIIRVTDLLSNYKPRQRKNIQPIGFVIGDKNLYLTNSDGKIIVADLSDGKITKIEKVSGGLVSEPFIFDNNLFVVRNGSIVQYN